MLTLDRGLETLLRSCR